MTEASIAYVRVQPHRNPGAQKYVAVRADDQAAFVAQSDDRQTIEAFDLDLPPQAISWLATRLDAVRRRPFVGAIIGTVNGDVWITGPLAGQRGPRYHLAGRKRCEFRTAGGDWCVMAIKPGLPTCPMHSPAEDPNPEPITSWNIWG